MQNLTSAIRAYQEALGIEKVHTKENILHSYNQNLTEYSFQPIEVILYPENRHEVEKIIATANEYKMALFPISSGRNWGLGSKLPVEDRVTAIVDLKYMNKIIEVNTTFNYAVIEPGVTQEQLYRYLEENHISLMINVTGSGKATSIAGNIMERGVGMSRQRTKDLRGLEIVNGNGMVVETGFGHYSQSHNANSQPIFYTHGLGPDLTHAFTQSNFGIVTKLIIDLLPKEDVTVSLFQFETSKMSKILDAMKELRIKNIIGDCFEMDSHNDPRLADLFFSDVMHNNDNMWYAWGAFYGSEEWRMLIQKEIKSRVEKYCAGVHFFDSTKNWEEYSEPVRIRLKIQSGIPTDYSLITMAKAYNIDLKNETDMDIDQHKQVPGFVCALPAIPFDGQAVKEIIQTVESISDKMGITPALTFSLIGEYSLEGFFRVYFNRSNVSEVMQAHEWNKVIHETLEAKGIYPYRVNNAQMAHFVNRPENSFWETVKKIKSVLDPNTIIAPGKYCPV
ncbi:MAG: 4-cresol dehydrogenase [Saprospiraceae bacterium]|nr:MAG: 4-cresol dehydrogenase [Saprospiraceae bacterium]